jgi:GGDEF domain-containing protein
VQATGAAAVRAEVLAAAGRLLEHVPRASVRLRGPGETDERPVARGEPDGRPAALARRRPRRPRGDQRLLPPAEVAEALQLLAAQASLGLQGAALTADLTYRASHDPLTDLANRAAVGAHLDAVIARAGTPGRQLGGGAARPRRLQGRQRRPRHAAGDRVLEVAARRLCAGVRDGDLVGRLGGDEFVVVVHGLSGEAELAGLVGRLETSLREPVDVGGRTVASVPASARRSSRPVRS